MRLTYEVRIQGIRVHKRKSGNSYTIRWTVSGRSFSKTYATKALAESSRSKLLIAQREGTAFDQDSGLPEPEARKINSIDWLELATDFVGVKWPHSSPKHRASIADALTNATMALLSTERGAPPEKDLRAALYGWTFNKGRQSEGHPSENVQSALRWLKGNTLPVSALSDAAVIRKALDRLALRLDGKAAAPNTTARRRAILHSALKYAVERRLLDSHPFTYVGWKAPKSDDEVDRRTVVNPGQAVALLAAVRSIRPDLEAFFGCMYYAALRPEEVLHLSRESFIPPDAGNVWGWLQLTGSMVTLGKDWGESDSVHHEQALKHRASSATRRVPVAPQLVTLLTDHIERYGVGPGGRLFVTRRGAAPGAPIGASTYGRVWKQARLLALTAEQVGSPLARVPYQLRHAAVSLWLNAGVPAPQVAEWAGHSLHVLLKVYAKCIDGQEETARQRIEAALTLAAGAEDVPGMCHNESDSAGPGETE